MEFRYNPKMTDVITRLGVAGFSAFMGLMREVHPTFNLPKLGTCLTRFDDVQDVFLRKNDFHVPYQEKVDYLDWQPTFLLAMSPGPEYDAMLKMVHNIWRLDDVGWISEICERTARDALTDVTSADAMQDVVIEATLNVIREYYGLPIAAEFAEEFLTRSFTLAGFLFGAPSPDKKTTDRAGEAIAGLWQWLDNAMDNPTPATPGHKSLAMRGLEDPATTREQLRSALMGMTLGFAPAGLNAFGRGLLVLLQNPEVRALACERASQDLSDPVHRAAFHRVYVESVRLKYILPGVWRRATSDVTIGPPGKTRAIKAGDNVFLAMPAAMLDRRRNPQPRAFDANRSLDSYMIYGYDFHFCVGDYIADNLAVETMGALFARGVVLDGKVGYHGMIPWKMPVKLEGR